MSSPSKTIYLCALLSGCVSISGGRNGPPRRIQRDSLKVLSVQQEGSYQVTKYRGNGTVADSSKPFGFGIGMKEGVAFGGHEGTKNGGAAMDAFLHLTLGFWRMSVSPQASAFMNIHGTEVEGRGQLVLAVPVELELAFRPIDRVALTGAFGKSVVGFSSFTDAGGVTTTEDASFLRGRGGLLLTLSNGDADRFERTLRLEGFLTTGTGATLEYRAAGGMLTFDFIGTTQVVY